MVFFVILYLEPNQTAAENSKTPRGNLRNPTPPPLSPPGSASLSRTRTTQSPRSHGRTRLRSMIESVCVHVPLLSQTPEEYSHNLLTVEGMQICEPVGSARVIPNTLHIPPKPYSHITKPQKNRTRVIQKGTGLPKRVDAG